MSKYNIDNVVNDLEPLFSEAGYTTKTIVELKRNIKKVVDLHHKQGKIYYNNRLVEDCIFRLESEYNSNLISRSRRNALIKAAHYVRDIATIGTIEAGVKEFPDLLTPYYRRILEDIKCSNEWSDSLNKNIIYTAHTYFRFLADANTHNITEITEETIRSYILQKASVMSANSLNTIRRNLKHLHKWLYKNGYIISDFADILSFTTPSSHTILRPVPHDEIALMFQAIDRNTAIGKRDYAMFMIAVVTGMRSVDIAALKFSNIDWIHGEIRIVQQKTGKMLALPLTTDIGESLREYILHGRPNHNSENIFLTSRPPIQPLGRKTIYDAFNKARNAAGLKKCPFHGLRRSVGTYMVVAGVPVTTVAQVLGHTNISSTKQYISLDSIHLKECALGLDGITQKGGSL